MSFIPILFSLVPKNLNWRNYIRLNALDWIAYALTIIGGLNWGSVGAFDFNLVAAIFGADSFLSNIIYILVGLSALYLLYTATKLRSDHTTARH